jgi:hypothetical protein
MYFCSYYWVLSQLLDFRETVCTTVSRNSTLSSDWLWAGVIEVGFPTETEFTLHLHAETISDANPGLLACWYRNPYVWKQQLLCFTLNVNCKYDEIKSELSSRKVCHHWVQNVLSLVSYLENQKMKIYKIITLYLLLCGSETLFFAF